MQFLNQAISLLRHCSRREELAPFQTAEAIDVRRKSDAFSEKVNAYRAFFQQHAPFAVANEELSVEQASSCLGDSCQVAGPRE